MIRNTQTEEEFPNTASPKNKIKLKLTSVIYSWPHVVVDSPSVLSTHCSLPICQLSLHALDFCSTAGDPLPSPSLWPDSGAPPSFSLLPVPHLRVFSTVSLPRESYVHPHQITMCYVPLTHHPRDNLHHSRGFPSSPSADSLL